MEKLSRDLQKPVQKTDGKLPVESGSEKAAKIVMGKPLDTVAASLRKKSNNLGLTSVGNKENNEKGIASVKGKAQFSRVPQVAPLGPIRKSQSTNFQPRSAPVSIKRTQSDQSISKSRDATVVREGTPIKKISSVQNVSSGSGSRQTRVQSSANHVYADLLANFEKEKKVQERRISELIQLAETRKTEIEILKYEQKNLKHNLPPKEALEAVENVLAENRMLKEKLKSLGVSFEAMVNVKNQVVTSTVEDGKDGGEIVESSSSVINIAAECSASLISRTDGSESGDHLADSEMTQSMGDAACVTPDHPSSVSVDMSSCDRLSVKSGNDALSEISVSCLQDRIQRMEESHYSTNEELQATLQELSDLQSTVNQLTSENEQLVDEKSFLMESLCTQTEKLENVRLQIDHLKALFLSKENVNVATTAARDEHHLMELLRLTMQERDDILVRQMDIVNTIQMYEQENKDLQNAVVSLQSQIQKLIESRQEEKLNDRLHFEAQVTEFKAREAQQIQEMSRLKMLLEIEHQAVVKYETERISADEKLDLLQLLNGVKQEKENFEVKLKEAHEELAKMAAEMARLKEQLTFADEEIRTCRSNEKSRVGDLEYTLRKFEREKQESEQQLSALKLNLKTVEQESRAYIKEKQELTVLIANLNAELQTLQQTVAQVESDGQEIKRRYSEEKEDWQQFQADLQTAVVVANNLRIESQEDVERLLAENHYLKDRLISVETEAERIGDEQKTKQTAISAIPDTVNILNKNDIRGRVLSTVDRELALRKGRRMTDVTGCTSSLSVKNLIASLEGQVKGMGGGNITPPMTGTVTPFSSSQKPSRQNSIDNSGTNKANTDVSNSESLKNMEKNKTVTALQDVTNALEQKKITSIAVDESKEKSGPIEQPAHPPVLNIKSLESLQTDVSSKSTRSSILSNLKSTNTSSQELDPKLLDKSGNASITYGVKNDPLANLSKLMGGSKRNALLKWCQQRTSRYPGIEITNFSSSWNDGLAFCALLHTYIPDKIPFYELDSQNKVKNFTLAFKASDSANIPNSLNVSDLVATERPDWQAIMNYVTNIYKHFEVDSLDPPQ